MQLFNFDNFFKTFLTFYFWKIFNIFAIFYVKILFFDLFLNYKYCGNYLQRSYNVRINVYF